MKTSYFRSRGANRFAHYTLFYTEDILKMAWDDYESGVSNEWNRCVLTDLFAQSLATRQQPPPAEHCEQLILLEISLILSAAPGSDQPDTLRPEDE